MFTAALFTVARTGKQPKSPSADEWIQKMSYVYTTECDSAIKRMKMGHFWMWMDLESIIRNEVRKQKKKKK